MLTPNGSQNEKDSKTYPALRVKLHTHLAHEIKVQARGERQRSRKRKRAVFTTQKSASLCIAPVPKLGPRAPTLPTPNYHLVNGPHDPCLPLPDVVQLINRG